MTGKPAHVPGKISHGKKAAIEDGVNSNAGGFVDKLTNGSNTRDSAAGSNTSDSAAGSNTSDSAAGSNTSDSAAGSNTSDFAAGSNTSDSAAGSNNNDTAAGSNNSDIVKEEPEKNHEVVDEKFVDIDPDDPLFKSPTNIDDRLKALIERDAVESQERENKKRAEQKAVTEFSSDRIGKFKFLNPIYNDDGEIVGYNNPLHIGHLDIRVGEVHQLSLHPQHSKQCRYTETLAINHHVKKPENFWGSQEEEEKIKEERNLVVESGIPHYYSEDDLLRQKVIVICNVKPFQIRGVDSKVVVLCAKKGDKVELLRAPKTAVPGDKIVTKGFPKNPQSPYVVDISKHIGDDLRVNENKQLVYKDQPVKVEHREGYITSHTLRDCSVQNVMGYDFI